MVEDGWAWVPSESNGEKEGRGASSGKGAKKEIS